MPSRFCEFQAQSWLQALLWRRGERMRERQRAGPRPQPLHLLAAGGTQAHSVDSAVGTHTPSCGKTSSKAVVPEVRAHRQRQPGVAESEGKGAAGRRLCGFEQGT